ncbi:MAG: sensor histidine kinase [Oscillospiraceae bacterium]|jgi:two-component system sensor histidine kinase CiaH
MIKTLQKKFVITAMTAITVLMLLMLGTINIVNIIIVDHDMDQTLSMISENEGGYGNGPIRQEETPPPTTFDKPKNEHDTLLSSTFFLVRLDENGNVISTDVSRTTAVTEAEAEEMALEVYQKTDTVGKSGKYRYQIQNSRMEGDKVIVFLDTSEEIFSYIRVLLLSALIGVFCWLFMLFFVMLLSKKAIRPIAENIEKQKQFVTNAGHEIKTPLAIILANTDAMELYNGENKWSKNIREQITRLNGLMKNLLMLARMDEEMTEQSASDFSLSELLLESVQFFIPSMELKQISLVAEIQPDIMLYAGKEHIAQLISILLDNAVKYTSDAGQIIVRLQKNEKRIKLQIENTCSVLPVVPPGKLFDRFYRADEARTQKSGGYGIGLSVAESIVKANKGNISAEYRETNRIIFTIRF